MCAVCRCHSVVSDGVDERTPGRWRSETLTLAYRWILTCRLMEHSIDVITDDGLPSQLSLPLRSAVLCGVTR